MIEKKRILILYDHTETHVKTITDYLESFHRYSRHNVSYVSARAKCHFDLDFFDAVILHYSVRICFSGTLSNSFARALKQYQGLKALFIQDEYDHTDRARQTMRDLGIGLVFTCVPDESIARVYPPEQMGDTRFVNVLTGYVPIELSQLKTFAPIRERSTLIGYRGRNLGYWYGDLGQEKQFIGQRMKEICDGRGLKTDIAWDEQHRIYGSGWFDFLGRCKATLATESGSNVFDFDGTLAAAVKDEVRRNPAITYDAIRAKYLAGSEGAIAMNQISPKVFEAIACRTALVLFERRYSDVLEPGRHFIVLKKDFSNVHDVLAKLHDDDLLAAMVERTYADIIGSGRYSYEAFVRFVDAELERNGRPMQREQGLWLPLPPADAVPAFRAAYQKNFEPHWIKRLWRRMPGSVRAVINRERIARMWSACPSPLRAICRPILHVLRSVLKPAH
ncbi:MAG: hypothetical protein HY289_06000 [Planctomycetes bacterium]|nr:hypothetical protein [Planctomycetota bacterium]